jgi:hypothetical protein
LTGSTVTVIVDPARAGDLERYGDAGAVWMIDDAATGVVVEQAQARGAEVTTFRADGGPEQALLSILDDVELHHGAASYPADPVNVLEIIGAAPTHAIRAALRELGYVTIAPTPTGFLAHRQSG